MSKRPAPQKGKPTLTEKAYAAIKMGVLRGEIKEGTFLVEREVMRRYRIGRTPYREACLRLHHEEILEVVPRRGYLVPELTFRNVRDIFEARLALEGAVVQLAAVKANSAQIEELERLAKCPQCPGESTKGYYEAWPKANTQFHVCLARMTDNRELVKLLTGLLERAERLSYKIGQSWFREWIHFEKQHTAIVEAVRRRDRLAAYEAVVTDIIHGQKYALTPEILGTPCIWPGELGAGKPDSEVKSVLPGNSASPQEASAPRPEK